MEKATEVTPQIMLSWEYCASSWSARMSYSFTVASSDPVQKAVPCGKNCGVVGAPHKFNSQEEEEDEEDEHHVDEEEDGGHGTAAASACIGAMREGGRAG